MKAAVEAPAATPVVDVAVVTDVEAVVAVDRAMANPGPSLSQLVGTRVTRSLG
jgi:hypothetical protein